MKLLKRRRALVGLLAATATAALVGLTGGTAYAAVPVTDYLQFCQTEGGIHYITNGSPLVEHEADCEATDATFTTPGDFFVTRVCIQGTTYLFADDDNPVTEFFNVLHDAGFSAALGACATPPPPQIDNVFLCYSTFSDVPAVFPAPVAAALLKGGGYWTPYAVPGNVDGGTNIGGYHLVCNLASGQAAGDNTLGGAGEVDGANTKPDVSNTAGYYPIIGG